jgi:hypothetical protein
MKEDFAACLTNPVGFKGFAVPNPAETANFSFNGTEF